MSTPAQKRRSRKLAHRFLSELTPAQRAARINALVTRAIKRGASWPPSPSGSAGVNL